ncbi:MAG: LacI family DNA-binding transcriptional regulator [Williamsia sp.]|nr:LacI family DNA-binding transcriptional regulator [Williamsia sp.]
MKFKATTIKDIAKALDMSTSTISRALRGSYEISGETKKLVQEYARSVNYRPNPIAQSLKERRSRSIGVIVSEVANTFFSNVINGIESIAYSRGYHVIISQSHESYEREITNLNYLSSRSVDGLLLSLSSATKDVSHIKALHEKGLPIVFYDRAADEIDTHKVIIDNFQGGYTATRHLIKCGYRRIAHLTFSEQLTLTKERWKGYQQALAESGISYQPEYVKNCRHEQSVLLEVEECIRQLLQLPAPPDAIFAASDRLTMGALMALKKGGICIPQEIALTGFTNSETVDLLHPPLTAVKQPAFEIGQLATELLIGLIESKRPVTRFETRILMPELTIRDSTLQLDRYQNTLYPKLT